MAYTDQAGMIDRYSEAEIIQLTDRTEPATGTVVTVVLNRALDDATAEIDIYLASRYILPLTTVPPMIVQICADIARYRLYDDAPTDEVRLRYEDAIKLLTLISKGTVSLGITPPPTASATSGPSYYAPDSIMAGGSL
jgi:phage gp36-like protein